VAHGSAKDFCGTGGCVLTAIADQLAILKDRNAPAVKRAAALRFIIHFVGDLHQPSARLDQQRPGWKLRAGEIFRPKSACAEQFLHAEFFHHVWDTEIPESQMQGADPVEFADTLDAAFVEFLPSLAARRDAVGGLGLGKPRPCSGNSVWCFQQTNPRSSPTSQ